MPAYAVDAVVRRSKPLQATRDGEFAGVALSPATIERSGLADGEPASVRQGAGEAVLGVVADRRVPDGCAFLPGGVPATAALGADGGAVVLQRP